MKSWETALVAIGGVVGGAALLWPLGIWWEVSKCEKPKYVVVRPLGSKRSWWSGKSPAELRQYAPMLVAQVAVSGTMKQASSAGFRKIADFIFGNNRPADAAAAAGGGGSQKIAMTAPVRMELEGGRPASAKIAMTSPVCMDMAGSEALSNNASGDVSMSFVMPSKYDRASLPQPNNPDVQILEVPSHLAAVLTFRGHVRGRAIVDAKKRELLELMQAEGLSPVGDVKLYQYHPPFTYGWQRVNEVVFQVADSSSSSGSGAKSSKKK